MLPNNKTVIQKSQTISITGFVNAIQSQEVPSLLSPFQTAPVVQRVDNIIQWINPPGGGGILIYKVYAYVPL